MGTYAKDTQVDATTSQREIERTLRRYGADQFMYGWDENRAVVGFRVNGRHIRFILPMPLMSEFQYTEERRLERSRSQQERMFEQAIKQRWRALALAIKAKLEAVESGIALFEEEFLAYMLLPDGSTVGEWAKPQLEAVYQTGQMPASLPGLHAALPPSGAKP